MFVRLLLKMEYFIESVKKYPCLWKVNTEAYKNIEIKENAWRNIISECDISDVKKAKCMWKTLRDGHRQALNKKKTTTDQAASYDTRLWKYEKQMSFLIPYLTNRQKNTNAVATENDIQITETETIEVKEYSDLSIKNDDSPKHLYSIPQTKRKIDNISEFEKEKKRRDENLREGDSIRQELIREKKSQSNENTALKKFFDSMCDVTSNMPEYLQIKVQRKIFNSVMEAQEEKLEKQSESRNSDFSTETHNRTHPCSSNSICVIEKYETCSPSSLSPTSNDGYP